MRGWLFGFGRWYEKTGRGQVEVVVPCLWGRNAEDTKKHQTPKWRQIGGAILTPFWWRELDLNQRPFGYEPNELPGCSIPRRIYIVAQVVSFGKGFLGLFWILEDFGGFWEFWGERGGAERGLGRRKGRK